MTLVCMMLLFPYFYFLYFLTLLFFSFFFFFFDGDHFKAFTEFLMVLLLFFSHFDFLAVKHVGSQLLNQRSNRQPLHLEGKVLTTGLPGKSHLSLSDILCVDCNT